MSAARIKILNPTILEKICALFFVLAGVILRLLPHPPNFAPIGSLALFGGAYFSRRMGLAIPVLAMFFSDIFLGFYQWQVMASVYGSFMLVALWGTWLKKHKKWYTVGGSALLSALLFFLITNFAVWAFTPMYTKNLAGLLQCYLMALPFFKNTLSSDIFYTACFFGIYELLTIWLKNRFILPRVSLST